MPDTGVAPAADNRGDHDWPVVGDPTSGTVDLVVGETVQALVMPAALGRAVYAFLSIRMLAGPVVVYPGRSERWVFLVEPASGATSQTLADLASLEVELPREGTRFPLPAAIPQQRDARWLDGPGRSLPPWHAVASAARSQLASRMAA